jgi:hypothetical protein
MVPTFEGGMVHIFYLISEIWGGWAELFLDKRARWPSQTRSHHLKYVEI